MFTKSWLTVKEDTLINDENQRGVSRDLYSSTRVWNMAQEQCGYFCVRGVASHGHQTVCEPHVPQNGPHDADSDSLEAHTRPLCVH